jgi:hypothetical protein
VMKVVVCAGKLNPVNSRFMVQCVCLGDASRYANAISLLLTLHKTCSVSLFLFR